MARVRLLNSAEDYERLGLTPGVVEPWEDGRRESDEPGHSEVWYFDSVLDDGSKLVFGVRAAPMLGEDVSHAGPRYTIMLTTADGVTHAVDTFVAKADSALSTDKCDLRLGPNRITGDLTSYDVHFEPETTKRGDAVLGMDLHLEAKVKPYRPGTGYIAIGDDDEHYLTFMCISKLAISGSITLDGVAREVTGTAYQNRQWTDHYAPDFWHHWLWGRQNSGDYTVTIYDLVFAEQYGFTRIPLFCVDDKDGNRVFENDGNDNVTVEILDAELQPQSGKTYPKTTRYTFDDGTTTVVYTVTWTQELDIIDHYANATDEARAHYDALGIHPTYTRYYATGQLEITRDSTTETSVDDVIYELNYPGMPDARAGF